MFKLKDKIIGRKVFDVYSDKIIDFKNYIFYIIDDTILGYVEFKEYRDEIIVFEVYVDEKHRRKGIATSLINQLIKVNKEIILTVNRCNEASKKLFESLDFKIEKELDIIILMVKK